MTCPHKAAQDCPLYAIAHNGGYAGLGCMTGDWEHGCAVERGEAKYPELVAQIKWRARKWWDWFERAVARQRAAEQRLRNSKVK